MFKFKNLLSTIIILLTTVLAFGQELKDPITIPSPNATSLGRYGNVPISFNTGAPNVNVPLYDIEVRGIPLSVNLNYDASGVRINRHPGWVGQNWSLSAGGVITRITKGAVDERKALYQSSISNIGYYSYFASRSYLGGMENSSREDMINAYFLNRDLQPDIFSFNFMGISGQFFLGSDGQWKVRSEHNLQVVFDTHDDANYGDNLFDKVPQLYVNKPYDKVIRGFKIKDGDGNIYEFGYKDDAIEYSIDFFEQSALNDINELAQWNATSWYLTKVTDKFGVEVYNFSYERGEYIAEFYRVNNYSSSVGHIDLSGVWLGNINCSNSGGTLFNSFGGNLISPVYLESIESIEDDKISFVKEESVELSYDYEEFNAMTQKVGAYANGFVPYVYVQSGEDNPWVNPAGINKVDFIKGLKWYKLSSIRIYGKQSTIKEYSFSYNDDATERLFLNQIDIKDITFPYLTTAAKYPYRKLLYNQISLLPKYFSKKVDHWGFFNGSPYNYNYLEPEGFFNQRESNEEYLKIGLLNQIIYPTTGSTKFKYEANSYSSYVSDDLTQLEPESNIAGGVRLSEVVDKDGTKETSKTYKYVSNYETDHNSTLSSGVLLRKPKYYWKDRKREGNDGYYKDDYFAISTIIPMGNSTGSHIGYSEVVEILDDNSYTIYNYTDYSDYPDMNAIATVDLSGSPYNSCTDRSFMRGKLKKKRLFDDDNNLVQETIVNYSDIKEDDYILNYNVNSGSICKSSFIPYFQGNIYKIYYSDHDIKEEEVINYLNDESVVEKTIYQRKNIIVSNGAGKMNVKLTTGVEKNISGDILKTEYRYPTDLTSEPYMQNLVENLRVNEIIQSQQYKNDDPIGCTNLVYKYEDSHYVLGESQWSKTDASSLEAVMVYDKYIEGKLVEYHKENNSHTCVIWGYNNKYPIAKIVNANFSEIEPYYNVACNKSNYDPNRCFDSGNCQEKGIREYFDILRTELPNSQITSYTYDPGIGVTSITDSNGITQYYTYDNFNRLQSIYNSDEKVIKSYEYNLRGVLEISLSGTTSCYIGRSFTQTVNVISNSNDLVYDLTLYKGSAVFAHSSSKSLSYIPSQAGVYTLKCSVTDNVSGLVENKSVNILVSIPEIEFINISPPKNLSATIRNADIYVQTPDVVHLAYFRASSNGIATAVINGRYYTIEPYKWGYVDVVVDSPGYIKCELSVVNGNGSAELWIQGANNSNLGNEERLSVPSPFN